MTAKMTAQFPHIFRISPHFPAQFPQPFPSADRMIPPASFSSDIILSAAF